MPAAASARNICQLTWPGVYNFVTELKYEILSTSVGKMAIIKFVDIKKKSHALQATLVVGWLSC
jgi:hypothetical protein